MGLARQSVDLGDFGGPGGALNSGWSRPMAGLRSVAVSEFHPMDHENSIGSAPAPSLRSRG